MDLEFSDLRSALTTCKSMHHHSALDVWILTDFAKLKKLLVSPVTILDEPANERFQKQAIVNENQHLLYTEEWQLFGSELAKA